MSNPYDPAAHAAALGLTVVLHQLHPERWGAYDDQCRIVYVQRGLTSRQHRAALAHEIVHAEHGDHTTGCEWWDARAERRADETAAERLIDHAALDAACLAHPHDPAAVAEELDVPRWLLEVALRLRSRRQAA